MRFLHPQYLWLLTAAPLLALVLVWSTRWRRQAMRRFAGGHEFIGRFDRDVSLHLRATKLILFCLALFAGVIAAARPQWGTRLEQVSRAGADVVFVLDTSLSMAAADAAPSRLGQARHEIDSLLQRLTGDRVALVTFAGYATLACPLTVDHAAVRLFLDAVDVESVPVPGTALAEALRTAVRAFGEEPPHSDRGRALLLFSDGEDHEGGVDEVLTELERAGVTVYAVGCGTTRGSPIPVTGPSGASSGYKKDGEGKVVTTRLDEAFLQQLALDSGGRYYRATATETEVDEIVDALKALDRTETGSLLRSRWAERFQFPLGLALVALLAETLLGDRRRNRSSGAVENQR